MHSVLPKQRAIKRFPLKGESVKGVTDIMYVFIINAHEMEFNVRYMNVHRG